MSRTNEPPVSLDEAERRIREAWPEGRKYLPASWVADLIWPDNTFRSPQGAGAAASRVLRQLQARGVVARGGDMHFWRLGR